MKPKGLYAGLLLATLLAGSVYLWPKPSEVAIAIGEPWAAMQQGSAVGFTPHPDSDQILLANRNARLRLLDPRLGFVTPTGREIVLVNNEKGQVETVGLVLGEAPMSLDQAIETATQLQDQWRQDGWEPLLAWIAPPIADTPQWREAFERKGHTTMAFWRADERYTATLWLHRLKDSAPGIDGRYALALHIDPVKKGH